MVYTILLSEEEEKAFLHIVLDINEWIQNAVHERARIAIDEVCKKAFEETDDTVILSELDKRFISNAIAQTGRLFGKVKTLPIDIKQKIVQLATIETAKQQNEKKMRQLFDQQVAS